MPPPPTKGETREQRDDRKRQEKKDYADSKLEQKASTCNYLSVFVPLKN